jgi:copper chaperone CopZ
VTDITFDDEKTSLKNITKALAKAGFTVQGEPVYLK